MSKLTATADEVEVTSYEYGEVLGKIENMEQSIIQHIRTSGVRKPRETALIDEVMELRRERRKFSSTIHGQLKLLNSQNSQLAEETGALRERLQAAEQNAEQLRRKYAESREAERLQLEDKLNKELASQEEKLKFMEKINIAKVRNKYDERLKEIDVKLKEMLQEKAKAELKEARVIALELVEKAKLELEKRCNEKIAEFKQSLVAIAAREKDTEASAVRYKQLAATLEEENSALKKKLATMSQAAAARDLRERDLEMTNCTLMARVEALGLIEQKLADFTSAKERELTELSTQKEVEHQRHLAQVDERIRKMLAAKDTELSSLRAVLRAKEGKLRSAEESLSLINNEIATIKKR